VISLEKETPFEELNSLVIVPYGHRKWPNGNEAIIHNGFVAVSATHGHIIDNVR